MKSDIDMIIGDQMVCVGVSGKGYLFVQDSSQGDWDYTLYDLEYKEIDGGVIDDPEMNIKDAIADVLNTYNWNNCALTQLDYYDTLELIDEAEGGIDDV